MAETTAAGVRPAIAHLHPDRGHLPLGVARIAGVVDDLVAVASAAGRGSLEGAGL